MSLHHILAHNLSTDDFSISPSGIVTVNDSAGGGSHVIPIWVAGNESVIVIGAVGGELLALAPGGDPAVSYETDPDNWIEITKHPSSDGELLLADSQWLKLSTLDVDLVAGMLYVQHVKQLDADYALFLDPTYPVATVVGAIQGVVDAGKSYRVKAKFASLASVQAKDGDFSTLFLAYITPDDKLMIERRREVDGSWEAIPHDIVIPFDPTKITDILAFELGGTLGIALGNQDELAIWKQDYINMATFTAKDPIHNGGELAFAGMAADFTLLANRETTGSDLVLYYVARVEDDWNFTLVDKIQTQFKTLGKGSVYSGELGSYAVIAPNPPLSGDIATLFNFMSRTVTDVKITEDGGAVELTELNGVLFMQAGLEIFKVGLGGLELQDTKAIAGTHWSFITTDAGVMLDVTDQTISGLAPA